MHTNPNPTLYPRMHTNPNPTLYPRMHTNPNPTLYPRMHTNPNPTLYPRMHTNPNPTLYPRMHTNPNPTLYPRMHTNPNPTLYPRMHTNPNPTLYPRMHTRNIRTTHWFISSIYCSGDSRFSIGNVVTSCHLGLLNGTISFKKLQLDLKRKENCMHIAHGQKKSSFVVGVMSNTASNIDI